MMMSIARRNIAAWRGRLAFSAGGVAVATLLLSFVLALYQGFSDRIAAYVEDVPVDVWIVGAGNESFFNPSVITNPARATILEVLAETGAVEKTDTLLIWSLKLRLGGDSYDSYVIGFDPNGVGGPVGMKKGSAVPGDGEIIIDDVLARQSGVDVGDTILAGSRELKVVGISTGGNLVVTQLSFVNQTEARILIGIEGFVNFMLVQAKPGQEQVVIDAISTRVAGVSAFPRDHFADSSKQVLKRNLLPVLLVVLILAFIVGTVVVGLTVYTAVVEKEREFGVLKAIGTPNPSLVRIVLEQSLVCALLGFAAGMGAAFLAAWGATTLVPQFVTLFRPQDIVMVFVLATVMSVIAALVPIQRIARVDPLTVFKA
jgi:putative ABC transport system permease protein